MYFPPDPSGPPLKSAKEGDTSESKLRIAFKKTVHRHKFLVSHLTFSDKLDIINSYFTPGEVRSGRYGYYRSEVVMISEAYRTESNCVTHYIQGVWMVSGKPENQNSHQV